MQILSRRKFVNVFAGGLAGAGALYLGKHYALPVLFGSIGDKPNIVLISIDTLRADFFSPDFMPQTFEWVKKNCVNYTNAQSNSTWTLPSHVTMLTGLLPHEHQVEYLLQVIPATIDMIQQKLLISGYRTYAFTGGGFVGGFYGFSRGFHTWYEPPAGNNCPFPEARRQISSLGGGVLRRPHFLFLHTFFVHDYVNNRSGNTQTEKYALTVKAFDDKLMDIIEALLQSPLSDDLKIIITSDHGEGFGETYDLYNRKFISELHGDWPCPSQTRIPLAIYDTRHAAGSTDTLVGTDEIPSIIEDWAGIGVKQADPISSNSHDRRKSLLAETIPFLVGLQRCLKKGADLKKRGSALIAPDGSFMKTWLDEAKTSAYPEQKLPADVQEKLKGLGYLQ